MRVCVYAFSGTAWFFRGLITACGEAQDDIEWSAIMPQWHFHDIISDVIPSDRCCYLYDRFNMHYESSDRKQAENIPQCNEEIVAALMKDKDGYRWLDKEEQLRRGRAIYETYREFLIRTRPDYILFPDIEAVDGFILINLCKSLGIGVLYYVSMRILGRGFFSDNYYESLPPYFGNYTEADTVAARSEIHKFTDRQSNVVASLYPSVNMPKPSLWRRVIVSSIMRWRNERLHASEDSLAQRIKQNIRPVLTRLRGLRFDIAQVQYFDIKKPTDPLPQKFIFFALQYTPESSINGLEPYYVDQMRVIDALLLNLPKGHWLVVKEHPAMYGVRPAAFYRDLRRRPGLILVHPSFGTRELIKHASLTATVTGTIGLECFLMGKPCLNFGRNFFQHLCYRAPALEKLKAFIENLITTYAPPTEEEKQIEIAKLLNIGGDFLIADPWFNPSVMSAQNIEAAREYLWRHLTRLQKTVKNLN